jgi:hypothetical protein
VHPAVSDLCHHPQARTSWSSIHQPGGFQHRGNLQVLAIRTGGEDHCRSLAQARGMEHTFIRSDAMHRRDAAVFACSKIALIFVLIDSDDLKPRLMQVLHHLHAGVADAAHNGVIRFAARQRALQAFAHTGDQKAGCRKQRESRHGDLRKDQLPTISYRKIEIEESYEAQRREETIEQKERITDIHWDSRRVAARVVNAAQRKAPCPDRDNDDGDGREPNYLRVLLHGWTGSLLWQIEGTISENGVPVQRFGDHRVGNAGGNDAKLLMQACTGPQRSGQIARPQQIQDLSHRSRAVSTPRELAVIADAIERRAERSNSSHGCSCGGTSR